MIGVMIRVDKEKVCCQTFSILSKMISFLNLKSLWGYGFPAISRYSAILRSYLTYYRLISWIHRQIHSQVPSHLDEIGFDFSILVARWFISLFADVMFMLSIDYSPYHFRFSFSVGVIFSVLVHLAYFELLLLSYAYTNKKYWNVISFISQS